MYMLTTYILSSLDKRAYYKMTHVEVGGRTRGLTGVKPRGPLLENADQCGRGPFLCHTLALSSILGHENRVAPRKSICTASVMRNGPPCSHTNRQGSSLTQILAHNKKALNSNELKA